MSEIINGFYYTLSFVHSLNSASACVGLFFDIIIIWPAPIKTKTNIEVLPKSSVTCSRYHPNVASRCTVGVCTVSLYMMNLVKNYFWACAVACILKTIWFSAFISKSQSPSVGHNPAARSETLPILSCTASRKLGFWYIFAWFPVIFAPRLGWFSLDRQH